MLRAGPSADAGVGAGVGVGVGVGVGEGALDSAADWLLDGGVSLLSPHPVRISAIDARPTATLENLALVVAFFCKVTKFPVC
ncbi:hypothetical protein [Arthrobacter sp. H14]|uniref:hypothetical protein n=1 Tax=Arthrobacter sp. H14 TaxID=1312959 RepID=UPI00047CAA06|nr:hypothetical protein [Arthrobacter sp. H14]